MSTTEHDVRAERRLLETALAEHAGQARVPDLTEAICRRLASGAPESQPRKEARWLTAAALLLGALATLGIALGSLQDPPEIAQQDLDTAEIDYLPFDATDPDATFPEDATAVVVQIVNPDTAEHLSLSPLRDHPRLRHAKVEVVYILGPLRERLVDPPSGWLAPLATCPQLRSLRVHSIHSGLPELRAFSGHPKLTEVWIHHPAVWEDDDTAVLSKLSELRRLTLSGVQCQTETPAALSTLGALENLQSLELEELAGFARPHQDSLARAFPRWRSLRRLHLGIAPPAFQRALGDPEPVRIVRTVPLQPRFVKSLEQLPALEDLALTGHLGDLDRCLDSLPVDLQQLTLRLDSIAKLIERPSAFARELDRLSSLRGLTLLPLREAEEPVFDLRVAAILAHRQFRRLHVRGPINPVVGRALAEQVALEHLTITEFGADRPETMDLSWAAEMPKLEVLRLQSAAVGTWLRDANLRYLLEAPRLRRILLTATDDQTAERLRAALPESIEVRHVEWTLDR